MPAPGAGGLRGTREPNISGEDTCRDLFHFVLDARWKVSRDKRLKRSANDALHQFLRYVRSGHAFDRPLRMQRPRAALIANADEDMTIQLLHDERVLIDLAALPWRRRHTAARLIDLEMLERDRPTLGHDLEL